jgi:hypothetical protein
MIMFGLRNLARQAQPMAGRQRADAGMRGDQRRTASSPHHAVRKYWDLKYVSWIFDSGHNVKDGFTEKADGVGAT